MRLFSTILKKAYPGKYGTISKINSCFSQVMRRLRERNKRNSNPRINKTNSSTSVSIFFSLPFQSIFSFSNRQTNQLHINRKSYRKAAKYRFLPSLQKQAAHQILQVAKNKYYEQLCNVTTAERAMNKEINLKIKHIKAESKQ